MEGPDASDAPVAGRDGASGLPCALPPPVPHSCSTLRAEVAEKASEASEPPALGENFSSTLRIDRDPVWARRAHSPKAAPGRPGTGHPGSAERHPYTAQQLFQQLRAKVTPSSRSSSAWSVGSAIPPSSRWSSPAANARRSTGARSARSLSGPPIVGNFPSPSLLMLPNLVDTGVVDHHCRPRIVYGLDWVTNPEWPSEFKPPANREEVARLVGERDWTAFKRKTSGAGSFVLLGDAPQSDCKMPQGNVNVPSVRGFQTHAKHGPWRWSRPFERQLWRPRATAPAPV